MTCQGDQKHRLTPRESDADIIMYWVAVASVFATGLFFAYHLLRFVFL